jgi:plastocyanin
MRIARRAIVTVGILVFSAAGVAACGGLAHPVSNDGNDANNPNGKNPGTNTLNLTVVNTNLAVGDTESVTGTYAGATLMNNGTFTVTSSDPSVVNVGGVSMQARSVGSATITASYATSQSTITISVHPSNGISAIVGLYATSPPAWLPTPVRVQVGSNVQFGIGSTHNVVFDAVPGAPANIAVGANGVNLIRLFSTAGAFTYQCTIHGEAGLINVAP